MYGEGNGWPMSVFSPYAFRVTGSTRCEDTESSGSRCSDYFSGSGSDYSDDALGLRHLIHQFYAPQLESELERLFCGGTGRGSPDSLSPTYDHKSVWDDFQSNGQEAQQLDELDKLFRGITPSLSALTTEELLNSAGQSDSSQPPSPTLEGSSGTGGASLGSSAVQDILTKAHLIDILREREQLHRSARNNVKQRPAAVAGGAGAALLGTVSTVGVTKTPAAAKSSTGKVCVFCRNNGEPEAVYSSHQLKDPEGNVTCPILYIYTCPICRANGKQAHTIKYCPYNTGGETTLSGIIGMTKSLVKPSTTSLTASSVKRGLPLI